MRVRRFNTFNVVFNLLSPSYVRSRTRSTLFGELLVLCKITSVHLLKQVLCVQSVYEQALCALNIISLYLCLAAFLFWNAKSSMIMVDKDSFQLIQTLFKILVGLR